MAVARQIAGGCEPIAVVALLRAREFESALQTLMKLYGAPVYRYCIYNLGDLALAADAHQHVFRRVVRDMPRWQDPRRAKLCVFRIARELVLAAVQKHRRAGRHLEPAANLDTPDPRTSTETRVDDARLHHALAAALARIDDATRAAVLLRYQQGLTFAEISEICGEDAGALRARVQRALPRLRKLVEARLGPL